MEWKSSERGFALIAALMANLILLAVGLIAINLSTQDIRISMKSLGDKKAMAATEAALHWLTVSFNGDTAAVAKTDVYVSTLEGSMDPKARITIKAPWPSGPEPNPPANDPVVPGKNYPPPQRLLAGYQAGGGITWGEMTYMTRITSTSDDYQANMTVKVGFGHGPVELGSMYR
jgi:hypothetical protein